jgi:hypothetical protein
MGRSDASGSPPSANSSRLEVPSASRQTVESSHNSPTLRLIGLSLPERNENVLLIESVYSLFWLMCWLPLSG